MDDEFAPLEPENGDAGDELERLAQESLEAEGEQHDTVQARQRCQRVIDLAHAGLVQDARDNFHAAWVLICGDSATHYQLARYFARRACALGEPRAWTLRAMAWDRWLIAVGKPQRFGTQILKQAGHWSLGAVDPSITDLERAFFAVPPLYVQQQRAEQLQNEEGDEA